MAIKYFAQLRARDPKRGNHHKTYNVAGLIFVAGGPEHEVDKALAAKLEGVFDIGDGDRKTSAFKIRVESSASAKVDADAPVADVAAVEPKPVKAPKPSKAEAKAAEIDPQTGRRAPSRE